MTQDLKDYLARCIDAVHQAGRIVHELDELVEAGFRGHEVDVVNGMLTELDQIEQDTDAIQRRVRESLFLHHPRLCVRFLHGLGRGRQRRGQCHGHLGGLRGRHHPPGRSSSRPFSSSPAPTWPAAGHPDHPQRHDRHRVLAQNPELLVYGMLASCWRRASGCWWPRASAGRSPPPIHRRRHRRLRRRGHRPGGGAVGQGRHHRHELGDLAGPGGHHRLLAVRQRAAADPRRARTPGLPSATCPTTCSWWASSSPWSPCSRASSMWAWNCRPTRATSCLRHRRGHHAVRACRHPPPALRPQRRPGLPFHQRGEGVRVLMLVTACAMAFAHGSNDVANAIGSAGGGGQHRADGGWPARAPSPPWILLLGAVGIVVGLITFGHKVIATIGSNITALTPSRGFAATLAAATTVVLASGTGLPVSTTHTLVGACSAWAGARHRRPGPERGAHHLPVLDRDPARRRDSGDSKAFRSGLRPARVTFLACPRKVTKRRTPGCLAPSGCPARGGVPGRSFDRPSMA
jgi:hypothetical protein